MISLYLDIPGASRPRRKGKRFMRKTVVLTDSACDLPQELADKHHIDIMCFKIALDGEGYTERVDFDGAQFCALLRKSNGLPTTSQVTQFEFAEQFERYASEGVEQVLYISINAGGSGTNAAAHAAAQEFAEQHPDSPMRVTIVDSHCYSMAYGREVIIASEMLESGKTMEEVVAYLEDKFARTEILLTAYTLKVIRKSGRVSAASAIAGDLLGIHPIFTLNDGVSQVIKKARGDKMVVSSMVSALKSRMAPGTPYLIAVTDDKYGPEYAEACEKAIGYPPERIFQLGCAVCSNTGPEAVGLIYEGAQKRER